MLRAKGTGLFPEPKITQVDIKQDGQFPKDSQFAVFQCIQDMHAGEANVDDLHRTVQANGKLALEQALEIENIRGASSYQNDWRFLFKGANLTPLHYAFLTGRVDAFAVLLAEGAEADKEFCFQCTSIEERLSEKTKTRGTLRSILYTYTGDPVIIQVIQAGNNTFMHDFLISMLQRQELSIIIDTLHYNIKHVYELYKDRSFPVEPRDCDKLFFRFPEPSIIKYKFEGADSSYNLLISEILTELEKLKSNARNKEGYFIAYNEEASDTAIEQINTLIHLYKDILNNLSDKISHDEYKAKSFERLLAENPVVVNGNTYKYYS